MSRRLAAFAGSAALFSLVALMPATASPSPVVAKASWSMVDLSKDTNGDGFIDGDGGVPKSGALTMTPSVAMVGSGNHIAQPNERLINGSLSWYLSPQGFPVTLNACNSKATRFTWSVTNTASGAVQQLPARALTAKACKTRITLPEGNYRFELKVSNGSASAVNAIDGQVKNILMLALGDSYASGEGNPRNVDAWVQQGGLFSSFRPYWDDTDCRRSVRSSPAQAALALERASDQTSVTFVDVTCSGATVSQGILGQQTGQLPSQLAQARSIIGDSPVDLVTLSIGGNDVGFGSIISSCLINSNCPLVPANAGPLRAFPSLNAGVSAQTAKLPGAYASIAKCFNGSSCANPITLAPNAAVLPTLYPDITRNAAGGPCSYLTMTSPDFAWSRDALLNPTPPPAVNYQTTNQGVKSIPLPAGNLNQQIQATAGLGWRPVTGTWARSGESASGHGICAGQGSWVFPAQLGVMSSGSFHPNPEGLRQMASAITEAAKVALG
ncbi:MAG: SGNH/GDSL hydrolase family protein [Actinomycetota bacterium]|nr:SGNH/GDSL hydrolase family protein [Actinomycetota bacterium]MDP2288054.1 SGNH/GDSL hydrolase family protein [Actinomycetota bacterium]